MEPISTLDVLRGLGIGASFLLLIALGEIVYRWSRCDAEWTRKLVHLGGGLICLSLPYAIESHWIALALAVSMAILLLVSRRRGWLDSIHAIQRSSRGSEYYPAVVYLLFLLSAATPWKYIICLLVLAVSDTVAAIVGTRYGRLRFRVEDESKSIEGSMAFFAATLMVVWVPLILMRPELERLEQPLQHYLWSAVLIGLLVTCFEAVSGKGRDNLFIPLGTYLVLTKAFQTDVPDLLQQNISFMLVLAVIVVLSKVSRSFHTGGAVVLSLASYGCWAMGSFDWALPVFVGYGLYVLVTLTVRLPWRLTIQPVVANTLLPFLIMAVGNVALTYGFPEGTRFLFGPFLVACCVALSQAVYNAAYCSVWQRRRAHELSQQMTRKLIAASLAAFVCHLLLLMPLAMRTGMEDRQTLMLLAAAGMLTVLLGACFVRPMAPAQAPLKWYLSRSAITLIAAIIVGWAQFFGYAQSWNVVA